jgi:hypothetical protein
MTLVSTSQEGLRKIAEERDKPSALDNHRRPSTGQSCASRHKPSALDNLALDDDCSGSAHSGSSTHVPRSIEKNDSQSWGDENTGMTSSVLCNESDGGWLMNRVPSKAWNSHGISDTGESHSSSAQGEDVEVISLSGESLNSTLKSKPSGFKAARTMKRSPEATLWGASTLTTLHTAGPPSIGSGKKRCKSGTVFSPLSKRKMEVLEANETLVEHFTRSRSYEFLSAVFIVLNAVFIIWETECRAQLASAGQPQEAFEKDELWFTAAANIFVVVFVVDLALRAWADGLLFLQTRERFWNIFDIFVTVTAFVEVMLHWILYVSANSASSIVRMFLRKFSMLRIIRLFRVIRMTRAIRVIRFVRELRLMVISLCCSLKPLAWSVVLMLIVLLVFGVFFTDGTVAYCIEHPLINEETQVLKNNFGTLSASTLSLYMAMTGGEDWANILHSLDPLPSEYRRLFIVFVTFAILALMNVVTAVFVGTAMQRSQTDRELVIQQELENKDEFVSVLQHVFEELDTNGSGGLSLEEFEQHIEDEKIMAYLRTMEINISQARTLFTLLDVDQGGEVDIDEFASGLLRLKGGATSMDMAILKYQVEWIHHNILHLRSSLGNRQDNESV